VWEDEAQGGRIRSGDWLVFKVLGAHHWRYWKEREVASEVQKQIAVAVREKVKDEDQLRCGYCGNG
jgi:hypothetical protein